MAVSTVDTISGPYTTNGVTTTFPFTFKVLSADEVRVFRVDETGVETAIDTGSFDVTLAENGGSVIFTTAPIAGDPLFIGSDPDFTQQITFENQGAFLPTVMNEAFDRDVVRALYLRERADRSLTVPRGESAGTMPPLAQRAGMLAAFSGDGGLQAVSPNWNALDGFDDGLWNPSAPITDDGVWG